MEIFHEVSILLAITMMVTLVMKWLKQPLVVGYILAGILVGPYVLNVLHAQHELELFSKVGIVFLLFIVGLHLNPKVIKEVGAVSLVTGIGQVVFTSVIGFVITLMLGIDKLAAMYIAIALTFSSTIIILKLLADKHDLQKLYAKIAIGFLLVQDILATLLLIAVTVVATSNGQSLTYTLLLTLFKGLILMFSLLVVSTLFLPKFVRYLAHSQEMLFLFSLAWGTGLASLFAALGFSIEIGALVAGVTLSMTPFAEEMSSRLKPLRDFFIVIFFILLGSQMALNNFGEILLPALVLSAFVLVGNPIIVIILMNVLGYNRKTGFLAGLTVAQISEFSLILASLGMRVGHLSQEMLSLVTLVGLITIAGSTYLILYAEKMYPKLSSILSALELVKKKKSQRGVVTEDYEALLFGYDRVGSYFIDALKNIGLTTLVVDYNPSSIEKLQAQHLPFRYGDASDVEFLEEIPSSKPKMVISTIPDQTTNLLLLRHMRTRNKNVILVMIAQTADQSSELYAAGASFVILPHYLGAEYAAKVVEKHGFDSALYDKEKERQQSKLEKLATT